MRSITSPREKEIKITVLEQKILRVNLSEKSIVEEYIPVKVTEKYIGGKGLAAYYLYQELKPKIDPLSPENKLLFFTGPLTGLPGYSRHVVASKSPLTDTFCDSYAGGRFGVELAKTRYSGIIVEGRSDSLVCLMIEDGNSSIEDAENLKGKTPYETDTFFKNHQVTAIGPAGERLVRFACIMNDPAKPGRAGVAGRGGLGAVMGSKNLKAVAIKGKRSPTEFFPEEVRDRVSELRAGLNEYLREEVSPGIGLGGNLAAMTMSADARVLPVRNFREGLIEGYESVREDAFKQIRARNTTCYLCPLACGVSVKVKMGPFAGLELDRIEYETVALNGPNCGQLDIGTIAKVNLLCNEYGMDTISVGNITSFMMECSERGLINYHLEWGDSAGQVRLVEMIGRREGIGDLLAEGVKRTAEQLGLTGYAVHIKGLEIPGYDVRGAMGMALAYATADRGGDHLRAWTITRELEEPFIIQGKAKLTKDLQDLNAALWCLIGCDNIMANTTGDPMRFVDLSIEALNAIGWQETFGWALERQQFLEIGERIYNLTRLFNLREGFLKSDDGVPERLKEARVDTGWKIDEADFEMMLRQYYSLRGWDEKGKPTDQTLERLQIEVNNKSGQEYDNN